MYHFRSPNWSNVTKITRNIAACLLGSAALFAVSTPAFAAASQAPQTRQEINQTRLNVIDGAAISRIDWRQPQMTLKFDLTESDWIDGIDLILSMTPQGNISKREPVLVSLNNSAPLVMNPYGQSFDARLRFDQSFVRAKGNVITIRVPAPDGAPCLTSKHGHWDVDTQKSSIVVRSRAKSRNFYLREVAERLQNPATAPKTVSLFAFGGEKSRLEMLGAQGIALQTADIPNFKTSAGRSDMEVIIGRRDQLSSRVTDREILSETGSKISVHKGRPMRLVITGDTDSEVLDAAKAFASHELPAVRRRETSSGEVSFQTAFANRHVVLEGKTRFADLNQAIYAMDWAGTPNTMTFNVDDPSVQSGNILLRLTSGPKISKDSRVEVKLNEQSLGFTTLDRRRKSVNFEIPEGSLHGVGNKLEIIPMLDKNPTVETFGQSCPSMEDLPGFFIGDGSRIELSANGATPLSELSRLTSSGSLFAANDGANTHIVLTAGSQSDVGASLELLAKLAKSSGTGWVNASVSRDTGDAASKNLLVIGPNAAQTGLLDAAPRALTAALNGKVTSGEMVRNFGDFEKFASADAAKTLQIYAAKTQTQTRIGRGGVAAVYPQSNRLIGVISSTPGLSFSSAAQDLIAQDQWNKLSGSVARWNSKTVLMAQTAIPTPQLSLPNSAPLSLPRVNLVWLEDSFADVSTKFADLSDSASERLSDTWSSIEMRLAGTMPAQNLPSKFPKTSETAPVYAAQNTRTIAKPAVPTPVYTAPVYTAPVYKVSENQTQFAAIPAIAPTALVAPLRGFSRPDTQLTAESRTPNWAAALIGKFRKPRTDLSLKTSNPPLPRSESQAASALKTDAAPIAKQFQAALQSADNPLNKLMSVSNRNFGFFGLLLAIAILIAGLMLSLITPRRKNTRGR